MSNREKLMLLIRKLLDMYKAAIGDCDERIEAALLVAYGALVERDLYEVREQVLLIQALDPSTAKAAKSLIDRISQIYGSKPAATSPPACPPSSKAPKTSQAPPPASTSFDLTSMGRTDLVALADEMKIDIDAESSLSAIRKRITAAI